MKLVGALLQDIVDDNVSLSSILRKAKMLAYALRHDELKEWIRGELDGYPNSEALPSYRVQKVDSTGTLARTLGMHEQRGGVPVAHLSDKLRYAASTVNITQGVRELEAWRLGEEANLYLSWPVEM